VDTAALQALRSVELSARRGLAVRWAGYKTRMPTTSRADKSERVREVAKAIDPAALRRLAYAAHFASQLRGAPDPARRRR
jgi:hypothetical protein